MRENKPRTGTSGRVQSQSLSHVETERREGESQDNKGCVRKSRLTKMIGLYREGQLGGGPPSVWAREFRVGCRVCPPY